MDEKCSMITLAAFLHGGIRQDHNIHPGQTNARINLDLDDYPIQADHGTE